MIYLICMQYVKAQNADNARMMGIWFDDKLREVYATNDFIIVRSWQ